jgi:hypothetical protein
MWDLFDRKVCLTLSGSKMPHDIPAIEQRWALAEQEFERVGISGVQKFSALYSPLSSKQSFNSSTRQILIEFFESDAERLLFLEDDCVFLDIKHLSNALSQVPEDWDLIYFGCNLKDERPKKISNNLFHINGGWTTHCIAYNKKCIKWILLNQPGFSECMFDYWLSANHCRLNAFVVHPMIARQRPGRSDIWEDRVDYTDLFVNSQKILDECS